MLEQPWRIAMLGGLQARQTDKIISRFQRHKTGLLLAYLAYYPRRTHLREVVSELLWPESEPEAARTNLRVAINSLRNQLEPPGILTGSILFADRANVHLNSRAITTDVADFEAALSSAYQAKREADRARLLGVAVDLYAGELLPMFYDDWVVAERERLAEAYLNVLRELTAIQERRGDLDRAIEYGIRAVATDPLREEAHHDLIRIYTAAGRPGDAQRQSQALETILQEEYGDVPSPEDPLCVNSLSGGRRVGRTRSPLRHGQRHLRESGVDTAPLPSALPPPPPAPRLHLPLQFTRFFGREEEIASLHELFRNGGTRLVTLTGAGGSGKTRLAIEFARQVAEEADRSIWFVALGEVGHAERIAAEIASTLGLTLQPEREALEQVIDALAQRTTLLILDNVEHLADEAAVLVAALRSRLPDLTCLVTSRQRLDLEGEQEFPVQPLPTPARPGTPERLLEFASVQLFVDRAQLVRPDFQVNPRTAAAVAAVCDRLEGIPLAIELAAAWAQTLTPAQMRDKLAQRFDLLESRKKDLPSRHRSLRAALDWSYRLLDPPLQKFFAHLSLFRGGWTLEAAEAVCAEPQALDFLSRLIVHSLTFAEPSDMEMRYRLLETLRDFADEHLEEQAREAGLRRHADYFLEFAEAAGTEIMGAEQALWLNRLDAEHENLRAALEWSLAHVPATALRLTAALWRFWYGRGFLQEGRDYLERALARSEESDVLLRARALNMSGILACAQGDYRAARRHHEAGMELYREAGDQQGIAGVLNNLGIVARHEGDLEAARLAYEQSLALYRRLDYPTGMAVSLSNLGGIALEQGDYTASRPWLEESLGLYKSLGNRRSMAATLHNIGEVLHHQGDRGCRRFYQESLAIWHELGERIDITASLASLAWVAKDDGDYEQSARLLGAAQAAYETIGASLPPSEHAEHDALAASLRARLQEREFAAALTQGQALTLEQAVEYALTPTGVRMPATMS